jgi:hypothetical protein
MNLATSPSLLTTLAVLAKRTFLSFLGILATMFGAGTAIKLMKQPVSDEVISLMSTGGALAAALLAVSILSIAVVLKAESNPR